AGVGVDVGGDALVAQVHGFFQRDLVEGVGGELDALGDHAGTVRLDLDADVVVHHALVGDEDLHRAGVLSWAGRIRSGRSGNHRFYPVCRAWGEVSGCPFRAGGDSPGPGAAPTACATGRAGARAP